MWSLFTAPENQIFNAALFLMLLLGVVEGLFLAFGGGLDWGESWLPNLDLLDWLYVGRVPLMMVLVILLTVFGLMGLTAQWLYFHIMGHFAHAWLATPIVALLALPITRWCAAGVYVILPRDETSAVGADELIGRVGVIILGTASANQAAEVRVQDKMGQQHYIMALADGGHDLQKGTSVLIVAREGHQYHVIENPSANLVD